MNTAAKGRRNEHRSMVIFEQLGYECIRAAASKGRWDFVAIGEFAVMLVQVKTGKWPSLKERAELAAAPYPKSSVAKVIHRWMPRQRRPDSMVWNPRSQSWDVVKA